MPVRLRVHFTGLCLFVPDSKTGELHVLLPATGTHLGDEHDHVDEHIVRLAYDRSHLKPNSTDYSGGEPEKHNFRGSALVIGAAPGSGTTTSLPAGIYDLDRVVGKRRVRRRNVELDPTPHVAARVTLGGGQAIHCAPAMRWDMADHDKNVLMTWKIMWAIDLPASDVLDHHSLRLLGLNQNGNTVLPPLHPTKGAVDILVSNVPAEGVGSPPDDQPDYERQAAHFRAYYPLVNTPGGPTPTNPSHSDEDVPGCAPDFPGPWSVRPGAERGDYFTCMVAHASLGD